MAIAYVNAGSSGFTGYPNPATYTISSVDLGSASNRCLVMQVCSVSSNSNNGPTGITVNGVSLSQPTRSITGVTTGATTVLDSVGHALANGYNHRIYVTGVGGVTGLNAAWQLLRRYHDIEAQLKGELIKPALE